MAQSTAAWDWRDATFSLKSFAAAMLALYIAFRLDLSQPSWSVTTVYVVSQPFAGMVIAKSTYRLLGTVIGAAASLLFVALFSGSPELFCLALALWIGLGAAVSIYLRDAPYSYAGMLSGYSAAIIGLPAALAPDTAFDYATARCIEIALGIGCGTLIHHVVFPQRAGATLHAALEVSLPRLARWIDDTIRPHATDRNNLDDRRAVIASVVALDSLRTFARLDTPHFRSIDALLTRYEGELLSLLALLLSVFDRIPPFRLRHPNTAKALEPLLKEISQHVTTSATAMSGPAARAEEAAEHAIRAKIDSLMPTPESLRKSHEGFALRSLLLALRGVLEAWQRAVRLRAQIAEGVVPPDFRGVRPIRPYRDLRLAMLGGLVAATAVCVASAFWIATAWPNGATAVTFAGVMCAVMGARDDPAAGATAFFGMSVVGAAVAALYLFVILPPLDTFGALVAALAPFYLLCGWLMAKPKLTPLIIPVIFAAGGMISVSNAMTYDVEAFLNGVTGYLGGIWIGAVALGLLRPMGTDWILRRLRRTIRRDLSRLIVSRRTIDPAAFRGRMFDSLHAVFQRLDASGEGHRVEMQGVLAALRVGLNVILAKELLEQIGAPAAIRVGAALSAVGDQVGRPASDIDIRSALAPLAAARASLWTADMSDESRIPLVQALYNVETILTQHADYFLPAIGRTAAPQEVTA